MTDRLPFPLVSGDVGFAVERASATPAGAVRRIAPPDAEQGRPSAVATSLAGVEAWMMGAITGPESEAALAPAYVTDGPRMTARERLEVYRYGYRARLVDCLADDYRALARTLGHEAFDVVANGYIDRFPSTSPSLNYYGRHFSRHVAEGAELPGFPGTNAFFAELAALEWALVEVIHAELAPPLDGEALRALRPEDWATARFEASDAVRLLRFEHPVNAFFQACIARDEEPPVPPPEPSATVVYRNGLTVWRMDLTPAMTRVLAALLAEVPISEALGRLGVDETDPAAIAEAERSVMVWFREWVAAGLFARLVVA